MVDFLTRVERSEHMGRIRGADTKPELIVRRLAHRMGYRYRLHRKDLPGRPDLVFPSRKKVIFVHGCFWHRCPNCNKGKSTPSTNREFWEDKLENNVARDARSIEALRIMGWSPTVIWECETKDLGEIGYRLKDILGPLKGAKEG